jgi:TRAP-type mannitol/chloroaromatic compound transport system permease small subunit
MPNLDFVLPLWLYWGGLAIFPLVAMYLVRRERARQRRVGPSLFVAYLFWLCAGFLGIHRFYLRSMLGFVFIPVFLGIVYCNTQVREVRDEHSRTNAELQEAERDVARAREEAKANTPGSAQVLAHDEAAYASKKAAFDTANAVTQFWNRTTGIVASVLAVMLVIDGLLLPGLLRRRRAREAADPRLRPKALEVPEVPQVSDPGVGMAASRHVHTRFTGWIDRMNVSVGEFVAYWSVIAVFAYYYEVLARYIFNSPTNWVHESMFLMFGMQYLLCGAYAYHEDQHVRVDIFYSRFSPRGKALADIVTSVFFFIFVGVMTWTGVRFALDAISMNELSFTEWAVQYWPIKLSIPIGAGLLLLQGVSKLVKDILIVSGTRSAAASS